VLAPPANFSDTRVAAIGDAEVSRCVDRNTPGPFNNAAREPVTQVTETYRCYSNVVTRVDFSNDGVELVCDINIVSYVDSNAYRGMERGWGGWPTIP
jgi:hypothetical protein